MLEGLKYLIGYPVLFVCLGLGVAVAIAVALAIVMTAVSILAAPFFLWKDRHDANKLRQTIAQNRLFEQ